MGDFKYLTFNFYYLCLIDFLIFLVIGLSLVYTCVTACSGKLMYKYLTDMLVTRDKCIKNTNSMISNIEMIKLSALEDYFFDKVNIIFEEKFLHFLDDE